MSSTFDTMAAGLTLIGQRLAGDQQASDVIFYLQEIVQGLHDEDHRTQGALNRLPRVYRSVRKLHICIQYPDKETRDDRLSVQSQNDASAHARVKQAKWTGQEDRHNGSE